MMIRFTKACFRKIGNTVKVYLNIRTGQYMKGISSGVNVMAEAGLHGQTGKSMMVNGLKVLNMVVECGKPQKEINM
jgi:hypothetical protein